MKLYWLFQDAGRLLLLTSQACVLYIYAYTNDSANTLIILVYHCT